VTHFATNWQQFQQKISKNIRRIFIKKNIRIINIFQKNNINIAYPNLSTEKNGYLLA
jgi:hypothetical protein